MAASRNDRPCVRASKRVRRCCFFSFAPLSHPPFLPTFIRACIYKRARFYTYKYTELASLLANTRLLLVLTYAISLLFPLIIFLLFFFLLFLLSFFSFIRYSIIPYSHLHLLFSFFFFFSVADCLFFLAYE